MHYLHLKKCFYETSDKNIHYTAQLRLFTSVKLNILQLQHLMNALKFTLSIYLKDGNCWEVIRWILISAFLDRFLRNLVNPKIGLNKIAFLAALVRNVNQAHQFSLEVKVLGAENLNFNFKYVYSHVL